MGHYAKINDQKIVERVIVADEEFINSGSVGDPAIWIKTSYNTRSGIYYLPDSWEHHPDQSKALRKNFAGIGYIYDVERDAFIPPQPFPSWVLNEFSCTWESPVPYPEDGNEYEWNEETTSWVQK